MFSSDRNAMASPIRFPSTANLAIDSYNRAGDPVTGADLPGNSGANFTITRQGNIMSGFFTRLAVTEVVLDWAIPNISATYGNNTFKYSVGGTILPTITIPDGNYTVESLMTYLVTKLNNSGGFSTWTTFGPPGSKSLGNPTGNYTIVVTELSKQLSITPGGVNVPSASVSYGGTTYNAVSFPAPELLHIAYLDFTSPSLTYQQGLKDADTSNFTKDVLYRWVFAWDDMNPVDGLGYPIYQGYTPFKSRRALNFPKQIKWDGQQPIGQLVFQVYGSDGELAKTTQSGVFEWYMNLLVSEQ